MIPRLEVVEQSLLPIKNEKGKLIKQKPEKKLQPEEDVHSDDGENSSISMQDESPQLLNKKPKEKKTIKPIKSLSLAQVKETLASLASTILEDPEKNIAELLNLHKITTQDSRPAVLQVTILTQLAVFKDIIPGYRIRKLTDAEQQHGALSKDVRKLRNFEETLLSNYQTYLQSLESISKSKLLSCFQLLITR